MKCGLTYRWSRLKAIPKLYIILWFLLLFFLLFSIIQSTIPWTYYLDKLEDKTVEVTNITLFDSRDIRGSRFKLLVKSNYDIFYLWYPIESFPKYYSQIESYLLSGEVSQVTVKYLSNTSLRDIVSGRRRIVDLRFNNLVFYDIQEEESRFQTDRFTYLIVGIILSIILVIYTLFCGIIYGVFILRGQNRYY